MSEKLKFLFLTATIGLLGLVSCTDEAAINQGNGNNTTPEVPEGMSALKLTFTAPGKTKSYADIPLTGTELENRIDSISIFLFDTNKDDTLVNVYTVPNPAANADTVVLVAEKSTAVKLVAIANPADSLVTHDWLPYINVIDLADFEKLTTLQHDSMPRPSFIMTAYNKGNNPVDLSGATQASAEFELTRLVARIDILNRDSVGLMHTFELQRARMVNIPSQAYLLPDQVTKIGAPVTSKKLTGLHWVAIDTSDDSEGKMESQLYMYPAGNGTDDSGVSLEIEGLYNGTEARYSIPFENRAILPNHRYIVTLDSINPVTVIASIKMVDWETDTVSFNPDNGGTPTVTLGTLPTGLTNITGTTGIDTIQFDGFQTAVIPFSVESPIVEPVFSTDANWITVTKETSSKSYADVVFKKSYEITVAQNPDMAREALIHFVNPAKPTERVTYCITQTISNNPLAKFAHQNLADVGEFVTGSNIAFTDPADYGKAFSYGCWFQFGRNYVFENNNGLTPTDTTSTKIAFADGTSSSQFIYGNPWHSEAGTTADTWYKLTNSVSFTNTDPCPTGYRLPTGNEILAVMPHNTAPGTFTTTTVTHVTDVNERTGANLTIKTGPAKYVSVGTVGTGAAQTMTVYGVKNLATDSAYVLRWTRVGSGTNPGTSLSAGDTYLRIDCKLSVDADFDVANASSFEGLDWTTNDVVTRYFPAAGYRHYNTGVAALRSSTGSYWSSAASSTALAWTLNFNSTLARLTSSSRGYGISVRCVVNDSW